MELCGHLAGDPLSLVQNEEDINTYEDAVNLLRSTYADRAQRYYHELEALKRGSKTIAEYNAKFESLKNKAKPLLNSFTEI